MNLISTDSRLGSLLREYAREPTAALLGRIRRCQRVCNIFTYSRQEVALADAILREPAPHMRVVLYLTSKGHSFAVDPTSLGSVFRCVCDRCSRDGWMKHGRWVSLWSTDGWHGRDFKGHSSYKKRRGTPIYDVDRVSGVLRKWAERRVRKA